MVFQVLFFGAKFRYNDRKLSMIQIYTKTKVRILGIKNGWSFAPREEKKGAGHPCDIKLEIQGSKRSGFHLVMSPPGFFTADPWYKTRRSGGG